MQQVDRVGGGRRVLEHPAALAQVAAAVTEQGDDADPGHEDLGVELVQAPSPAREADLVDVEVGDADAGDRAQDQGRQLVPVDGLLEAGVGDHQIAEHEGDAEEHRVAAGDVGHEMRGQGEQAEEQDHSGLGGDAGQEVHDPAPGLLLEEHEQREGDQRVEEEVDDEPQMAPGVAAEEVAVGVVGASG